MDIPKFSARRDKPPERQAWQAPRSVSEMKWVQDRPKSLMDFLTGRFIMLLLMAGLLAAGVSMLRSRGRAASQGGELQKIIDSSRTHVNPTLPAHPHPTINKRAEGTVVDAQGKPIAAEPAEASGERKPGAEETPGAEAEAPASEEPQRRKYTVDEAKVRKFQEMLPNFEKLEDLDPGAQSFTDAFEVIFDDNISNAEGLVAASEVDHGAEAIWMLFRYLRTHADRPETLEAYYQARKEANSKALGPNRALATFSNVMTNPDHYRGQAYKFEGSLIKKYQIRNWGMDAENKSGVRDTWMVICRDDRLHFYALLVPQDIGGFRSKDDVDAPDRVRWTGLFLQRWSYVRADQQWDTMPIYVALKMEHLETPESGTGGVVLVAAVVMGLGLFLLVRMTRGDERKGEAMARHIRTRQARAHQGTGAPPADAAQAPPQPPPAAPPSTPAPPAPPEGANGSAPDAPPAPTA
ncbi:MAG: hypothetical protein KIS92_00205 [Planctomycetota bacterium]|nr:hypothetical protein [Planctomycetota bacterium]